MKCRFVLLLIVILTPFFIHNIEKSNHGRVSSTKTVVTSYLCAQKSESSQGYFRVDFTDDLRVDYTKICKSNDILLIYIL